MTDTLKPEQRKRVAEATTGNRYMIVTTGPNGGGMPLIAEEINPDDPGALWKPHKKSDQWKALVTWLAEHIHDDADWLRVKRLIQIKDVDGLEIIAHEIPEAQDD